MGTLSGLFVTLAWGLITLFFVVLVVAGIVKNEAAVTGFGSMLALVCGLVTYLLNTGRRK